MNSNESARGIIDNTTTKMISKLNVVKLGVCVLSITLNLIAYVIIVCLERLREKRHNQFFLNLQLAHFFFSVFGIVVVFYPLPENSKNVFVNSILVEILLALLIISVDRFLNVKYAFTYQHVALKNVFVIVILAWLPGVILLSVSITYGISQYVGSIITCSLFIAPFAVLMLLNVTICKTRSKSTYSTRYSMINSCSSSDSVEFNSSYETLVSNSLSCCHALVAIFGITWLPYLVQNLMLLIGSNLEEDNDGKLTLLLLTCAHSNSLLNPVLFFGFNKEVSKELTSSVLLRAMNFRRSFSRSEDCVDERTPLLVHS